LHGAEPILNAGTLLHGNTRIPPEVVRSFIEELM
jgi:hypothetical protein